VVEVITPETVGPVERVATTSAPGRSDVADEAGGLISSYGGRLRDLDESWYDAIAGTRNPTLNRPVEWISNAANGAQIWLAIAGALALIGGSRGRRTAARAVMALTGASLVANLVVKPSVARRRPTRDHVLDPTKVRMPTSSSFPSGHTATAFGFAAAVSADYPALSAPLLGLAGLVGYSRIHAGVHYPADVVGGGLVGIAAGLLIRHATGRFGPTWLRDDRRTTAEVE
jgi:membrane-associated phospholipid phosphatase